jgi:hypothetical protein
MANPSNLYAEKIFSEHPIAMWALDDQADYISLISNAKRDIYRSSPDANAWTISNGTKEQNLDILNEPLPTTSTTTVKPIIGVSQTNQITLTSSGVISPLLMSSDLETFSIGAYIFAANPFVLSYEIGYIHDGLSSPVLRKFDSQISNKWSLISETFSIPQTVNPIKIVIRINHVNNGGLPNEYQFYVNGITFGQWSEEFLATSPGVFGQSLPVDVPFSYSAIDAKSYGLQDLDGYYFINDNKMLAKNSGAPMVYGSSNVTRIISNLDSNVVKPSLIIPGQGFLNEAGRYREYTAEMWARIDYNDVTASKIFGPIGSTDGIYAYGPFITIQVGESRGSHPIGEWGRPMLLDFKVSENSASLLINGEQAITISYSTQTVPLAEETVLVGGVEKNNDWLGFYAPLSGILDIDCVAIYPYLVPAIVAKRRFAYGQAVEFPENANSAYGGTSVLIDYAFADYTSNYSYPDIGRWDQAIVENLIVEDDALSAPEYSLPTPIFEDGTTADVWAKDLQEYYLDNLIVGIGSNIPDNPTYFNFLGKNAYISFETLNILRQDLKALFGIFKVSELQEEKQILFKIEDKTNSNFLEVYIEDANLIYRLYVDGQSTEIYSESAVVENRNVIAGISLDKFSTSFGQATSAFFNNKNRLSLSIGGDKTFDNTFVGDINSFSFCSKYSLDKISQLFDNSGLMTYYNYEDFFEEYPEEITYDAGDELFEDDPDYDEVLEGPSPGADSLISLSFIKEFIASYTLIPTFRGDSSLSMGIAVDGYWEDYLPLTYFAQYVSDTFNKKYYDLDFIQFNIDYPAIQSFSGKTRNTEQNLVRSYVSFQYLKNQPSSKDSYFTKAPVPQNGVISPGSEWITTKYEVVNGTIIYPPKGIRISDVSLVTHLEWSIPDTISSPLIVKKLQYASQAFNERTSNPVGTRFGVSVFPYLKYGSYFDYKSRNPFRIYKGSTPYLYLTKDSGIQKVGNYDALVDRGLSIPINQNLAQSYKVIALQAFIRYGQEKFPTTPEQIFEIESKDTYIKFFIVANDTTGQRARIYGINARTGRFENGIAFYWNGKIVREPVITLNDWGVLGISFPRILDFDSYAGGFRITGSVLVNNISQYQSTNLQEIQRQTLRSWYTAKYDNPDTYDWDFWNEDYTWNGVLVFSSSTYFGINPSDIYKTYTGTNKIIIDDDRPLRVTSYEYNNYQGIAWQNKVITAV